LTNCCGVSPLRLPPSSPASEPPELDPLLVEPPLLDPEDPPLEEPPLLDPEDPPLEELPLPDPEALEESNEPPASVVCAAPSEGLEPHAVEPRKTEINPHRRMRRMFTSLAPAVRWRAGAAQTPTHGACLARLPRALRNLAGVPSRGGIRRRSETKSPGRDAA